jgi:hypothetical protein
MVKTVPWLIWLVTIALLLLATAKIPYAYYTLLRFAICGFSAIIAFAEWEQAALGRTISISFAFIALLFNPLAPFYLKRGTWFYIDIVVAVLVAAHLIFRRLHQTTVTP